MDDHNSCTMFWKEHLTLIQSNSTGGWHSAQIRATRLCVSWFSCAQVSQLNQLCQASIRVDEVWVLAWWENLDASPILANCLIDHKHVWRGLMWFVWDPAHLFLAVSHSLNCLCWFPWFLCGVNALDLLIFLEVSCLPMPFSCFLIQCILSTVSIFSNVSNRLVYFLMSCWLQYLAIGTNCYKKMATNSCQELPHSKQWLETHGKIGS